MLDLVTQWISASPWTYAVVAGLVLLDLTAVIPAETVVIAAVLVALDGELSVWLLLPSVAVGALLGDQILYLLGRTVGGRAADKIFTSERERERLRWAQDQMKRHGRPVIVGVRFVPVGRTATVFGAGTLGMAWRRFIVVDVVAVVLYSAYVVALGWFGGQAFQESFWKPLLVSLGVGAVALAIAEGTRRLLDG